MPESQFQQAETQLSQANIRVLSGRQALINLGLHVTASALRAMSEQELAGHLQFLGLPETIAKGLDPETTTSNLLPVTAPIDGVVVARAVVAGEVVDTARVLFHVADTSRMWLMLNVPLESDKYVAIGRTVLFTPDGGEGEVAGEIGWISTEADQKTRTVLARANVDNRDGRLRNETFGRGRIVLREVKDAIVVPAEAVQWDGSCSVVFVRDKSYFDEGAPKVFYPRPVRPGAKLHDLTEIIAGVLPGEVIATKGSNVLVAELLKSNLGAG